ncbi:MAG: hypothetical protein HWN68_08195 [Desulfobacterales bacterium]|nr:hypothetical protein [Desulfobacterales bacterium]
MTIVYPPQQIQPYQVQAMWVSQAITVLAAIGMFCFFAAEVLKALTGKEEHHSQEEETRFIGGCKVVNGLCHTHSYSVSKRVRCPKSPFTDEEWSAAWELAEAAFPEGMSNPWVNGWWPGTREEAEGAAKVYEVKMRDAIRMFREKQRKAIENYERAADKAAYNYRRYVIGEYERGKELSVVASASQRHSVGEALGSGSGSQIEFPRCIYR